LADPVYKMNFYELFSHSQTQVFKRLILQAKWVWSLCKWQKVMFAIC